MNKTLLGLRTICEKEMKCKLSERRRRHEDVICRAIYYKVCRDLMPYSLKEIGASVGRDHATVLHSLNTIFWREIDGNITWKPLYLKCKMLCKRFIEKGYEIKKERAKLMLHENINLKHELEDLQIKYNRIPLAVRIKYL